MTFKNYFIIVVLTWGILISNLLVLYSYKTNAGRVVMNSIKGSNSGRPNKDSSKSKSNIYQRQKTTTTLGSSSQPRTSRKQNVSDSSNEGIRVNKCISSLSRRACDDAINEGRITINNRVAKCGDKVNKGDVIKLDGVKQQWEHLATIRAKLPMSEDMESRDFIYLKYWKPVGVTCTSDLSDKSNIITAGKFNLFPQRLFTVGRLDKDSTGLIIITSDGRVNNAMLSPTVKKEKVYEVLLNRVPTDDEIKKLADGVVITTVSQRDTYLKPVTAKTLPCKVTRNKKIESKLEIVLTEGRNRQIRKMIESLGMEVIELHRTYFSGISLSGLSADNWSELNEKEMTIIRSALEKSSTTTTLITSSSSNSRSSSRNGGNSSSGNKDKKNIKNIDNYDDDDDDE